ncbi:SLAC1 anion channel family protein [Pseudoprimorskyibacter insulae]|uniref:Tellurite resistance protein TehA n=1 Tax=Pseudoprimorskyibacter insulae TaxID=1695997 RepID=A0A2R8AUA3_9RHOB|nr:SLAC1 anion channel family protein [Pseudoprimorskyibacter insulae]SPF79615.1 Tellurite resistance protein TehA [Pseudoprimorskyibacter insulae]
MNDKAHPAAPTSQLAHFHITFFASVMGLAGLTLATHRAELQFGWSHTASDAFLLVTLIDFVLISVLYMMKALRFPGAVAAEWNHPVKLAFFPAISISLLLIATALRNGYPQAANAVWITGAAIQGVLTIAVISGWIGRRPFQPMHISPAWFIPAVGNVVVPIAGVGLGFVELSWLFFSAGLIFWIILLTLVMNRLIFHDPLPGRLLPTLVILIAPPAVAFVAWLQLNGGQLDTLARILYYGAVTFAVIVAVQAPGFAKLPFALSWWALSFPVAALTIASFRFAELTQSSPHLWLATLCLILLVVIVAALVGRTILGAIRREICLPE